MAAGEVVWHPFASERNLEQQLRASLAAIKGVSAGVTVGDFKRALERLGVSDDYELASIEFGIAEDGTGVISVDVTPMGIEIRERVE